MASPRFTRRPGRPNVHTLGGPVSRAAREAVVADTSEPAERYPHDPVPCLMKYASQQQAKRQLAAMPTSAAAAGAEPAGFQGSGSRLGGRDSAALRRADLTKCRSTTTTMYMPAGKRKLDEPAGAGYGVADDKPDSPPAKRDEQPLPGLSVYDCEGVEPDNELLRAIAVSMQEYALEQAKSGR